MKTNTIISDFAESDPPLLGEKKKKKIQVATLNVPLNVLPWHK